ncbi:MAG: hypothetical protein ACW98D_20700, partial [Promethearchaeota archaeon]
NAFLDNCYVCPNGNSTSDCTINAIRRRRINNQSRMSSSMGLLKKRSLVVSKQVGQCADPQKLLTAGGPGDWAASIQKSNYPKAVGRAACYNMGRLRNRTAYKNNRGVDRKHGSYNRYLARRVGGVLRAEQMPAVINKTAFIGQPRIRSGTRCDCNQKETTKKCGDTYKTKDYACCNNRIALPTPTSILTVGLDVGGYNFYGYLNAGTGALNPPFKIGGQDVKWIGYQARDPSGLSGFDNRFYVTLNTLNIATQNDLTSISFVGEDCSIKTYYGADAEFSPTASGNGTTWWWPAASQVGLPSDPNEVAYWSSQVGKNLKVYINTNPNLLKPYISPSAQRTCVAGKCKCCSN